MVVQVGGYLLAKPKPGPKLSTLYMEIPFGDKTRSNILESRLGGLCYER